MGMKPWCAFGAVGPQKNLHRQRGRGIDKVGRRVGDKRDHSNHQQRRGLSQRLRHPNDRAGEDAGHRRRQHMMKHALHSGRAQTQRRRQQRRRHSAQSGARGDDDGRQSHQRQHQAADQRRRARQLKNVDEHRQTEQAEDDSYIDFVCVGNRGLNVGNAADGDNFMGNVASSMIAMRQLNVIFIP